MSFFYVVSQKNPYDLDLCGEPRDFAYMDSITNNNLVNFCSGKDIVMPCETKKEAERIATDWNNSYKDNEIAKYTLIEKGIATFDRENNPFSDSQILSRKQIVTYLESMKETIENHKDNPMHKDEVEHATKVLNTAMDNDFFVGAYPETVKYRLFLDRKPVIASISAKRVMEKLQRNHEAERHARKGLDL